MTCSGGFRALGAGLGLITLVLPFAGCNGRPGETGNVQLVLPNSLSLDAGDFPDDSTDPDTGAPAGRVFDSANARACATGGAMTHAFHRLLDRGLGLAAAINEDVSDPSLPNVEGIISTTAGEVRYKADFSPFDIDGDGTADGSGRFDTAPIALRMWTLDESGAATRFLCALITTTATTRNAGAGELYAQPGAVHPQVNPDFRIFVQWDRTDESYRWNQAHTNGTLRGNLSVSAAQHLVEHQRLGDGSMQKTLRTTATLAANDFDFTSFNFAGRSITGTGVGVVKATGQGTAAVSIENICISLPGCTTTESAACLATPISDLAFLGSPSGAETEWPAAFPEQPTF